MATGYLTFKLRTASSTFLRFFSKENSGPCSLDDLHVTHCLRKRFQFGQDGGEVFRNRRMNMHCALYYRIRRLRIHDVQQDVNYFIASGPKNRSTQNLFCFPINTDFHETLGLTFLKGPAYSD